MRKNAGRAVINPQLPKEQGYRGQIDALLGMSE